MDKKEVVPLLLPLPDGLHFTPAMSTKALHEKLKILEIPVPYSERSGRSKLRIFFEFQFLLLFYNSAEGILFAHRQMIHRTEAERSLYQKPEIAWNCERMLKNYFERLENTISQFSIHNSKCLKVYLVLPIPVLPLPHQTLQVLHQYVLEQAFSLLA